MNFSSRIFLGCILFLFTSLSVFSQTNPLSGQNLSLVKIDNLSDEEISNYHSKAIESGLDDQEIFRILKERGLPTLEMNKLADRVTKLNSIPKKGDSNNDKKPVTDNKSRYWNQDADQVPMQAVESDLTVFGSELFTRNSLVFEPNLRIPTPSGYILGPDDELIINVFGYSERTYNVTVNEEGNIYIPQVGPLFVNGLSIEQAASRIKAKLASTIYRAINSGQTRVQISLGKIRSIRVTVIGEAKKPGTLTVSSLTTLFNLLYLVGGPSDFGTYRKIELIRGNELRRTIDLYAFLLKGDQKDNVLLQEGDVIRIPYYTTRVLLNGNVKRKGKYELIEGETFENVLQFSGGFADDAYKAGITVYQLTEADRKIMDVSKNEFRSYQPLSSDSIVVGKLLNRFTNKLVMKGAVMRPGDYELSAGLTLKQLIEKAGGVNEDVYSNRGSISRLNSNNTPVQVSFNIDSVLNNLVNIPLKKNDEVTIFSIFDLKAPSVISIDGYVTRPGTYAWAENITLQDVILTSGGITEAGDNKNIEIARRITNLNLRQANYLQTEIIMVDLSDSANAKDIALKPFDVVNIRQKSGFANQRIVLVEGSVLNPGRYTLQMSVERISDVLKRSGGFMPNADSASMIIRRPVKKNRSLEDRENVFAKLLRTKNDSTDSSASNQSIRMDIFKDYDNISIDLKAALRDPGSLENMMLEDGDILTIENNSNLVKVSGEVYFPTIIPFKKNENLKYYIEKSGSYTPLARRKAALVIYPDGKAKTIKRFLFFKSYPEVVSRSQVFVPQKSERNRSRFSIGEWSVVLSSLAIIANVIINTRN